MAKKLKDYPAVSLKLQDTAEQLDFADIFGRKSAVHIEIGSGKGTFLVSQAAASPHIDFLGIEWAGKYYRHAVDRIGRWQLPNVRITRTDAAVFLDEKVPQQSVDCFHIYFPDPWPKARHNKRRLICEKNMPTFLKCLKPAGIINIATDHLDYYEQIQQSLSAFDGEFDEIDFIRPAGAEAGEFVGTNYERKYIKQGKKIYTAARKKLAR